MTARLADFELLRTLCSFARIFVMLVIDVVAFAAEF
jgi:hypothetical protein